MEIEATQAIPLSDYEDETEDERDESPNKIPVGFIKVQQHKECDECQFPIYEGVNTIGRDLTNSIPLVVKSLSKEHCRIEVINGSHLVYDVGSRNKTRRNKVFLTPEVRYELNDNDMLTIGDVTCTYVKSKSTRIITGGSDTDSLPDECEKSGLRVDDTVNEDEDIANDNHRVDFDDEDSNMSDDLLQPTQCVDRSVLAGRVLVENSFNNSSLLADCSAVSVSSIANNLIGETPPQRRTSLAAATQYIPESDCETDDEGCLLPIAETQTYDDDTRRRLQYEPTQAFLNETEMEPTQVVGFDENAATRAFPSSPSRETELETNATQTMVIGQTAAGSQETAETAATQCFVAAELSQTGENAPTQCYTESQLMAADIATPCLKTTKKSLVCQSPSTLCSPHSPPRATLAYDMELASTQVFNDVGPWTANAGNLSCWDIPETQCFDAAGPGSDAATQCGVDETQVVDADDLGWNAATQSGVDVKRVVDSAGTEFEGATQSGVEDKQAVDAGCPKLEYDAATQSGVEEKQDLDLPKLDTNLNSPSCEQDKRGSLGENCNSEASSPILSDVSKIVGEDQNFSTTSFQKPSASICPPQTASSNTDDVCMQIFMDDKAPSDGATTTGNTDDLCTQIFTDSKGSVTDDVDCNTDDLATQIFMDDKAPSDGATTTGNTDDLCTQIFTDSKGSVTYDVDCNTDDLATQIFDDPQIFDSSNKNIETDSRIKQKGPVGGTENNLFHPSTSDNATDYLETQIFDAPNGLSIHEDSLKNVNKSKSRTDDSDAISSKGVNFKLGKNKQLNASDGSSNDPIAERTNASHVLNCDESSKSSDGLTPDLTCAASALDAKSDEKTRKNKRKLFGRKDGFEVTESDVLEGPVNETEVQANMKLMEEKMMGNEAGASRKSNNRFSDSGKNMLKGTTKKKASVKEKSAAKKVEEPATDGRRVSMRANKGSRRVDKDFVTVNDEDPNCSQPQPQEAVDADSNLDNNKLSVSRRKSRVLPTKELKETVDTKGSSLSLPVLAKVVEPEVVVDSQFSEDELPTLKSFTALSASPEMFTKIRSCDKFNFDDTENCEESQEIGLVAAIKSKTPADHVVSKATQSCSNSVEENKCLDPRQEDPVVVDAGRELSEACSSRQSRARGRTVTKSSNNDTADETKNIKTDVKRRNKARANDDEASPGTNPVDDIVSNIETENKGKVVIVNENNPAVNKLENVTVAEKDVTVNEIKGKNVAKRKSKLSKVVAKECEAITNGGNTLAAVDENVEGNDETVSKRTTKLSKSVSTVCSDGERVTTANNSCPAVDTNTTEDLKNIGASMEAESVEENNKPIGRKRKAEKALTSDSGVEAKVGKLQTVDGVKNCGAFAESTGLDKKNEKVVNKIEEVRETGDVERGLGFVNDEKITGGRKKNVDCKSKNIESEVTEELVSKSSIPNKGGVNSKKLKKTRGAKEEINEEESSCEIQKNQDVLKNSSICEKQEIKHDEPVAGSSEELNGGKLERRKTRLRNEKTETVNQDLGSEIHDEDKLGKCSDLSSSKRPVSETRMQIVKSNVDDKKSRRKTALKGTIAAVSSQSESSIQSEENNLSEPSVGTEKLSSEEILPTEEDNKIGNKKSRRTVLKGASSEATDRSESSVLGGEKDIPCEPSGGRKRKLKTEDESCENNKTADNSTSTREMGDETPKKKGRTKTSSVESNHGKSEAEEESSEMKTNDRRRKSVKSKVDSKMGPPAVPPAAESSQKESADKKGVRRSRMVTNDSGVCLKPKVMFTGVEDLEGQKILKSLGGEMVESIFECSHLISDQARRTVKFLCGVARGIPVVIPEWLQNCKAAHKFLDASNFLVEDRANEKKFAFNLRETLKSAAEHPLLTNYRVHVTEGVKPEPNQMKDIILCAGGKFVPTLPKKFEDQLVVVTCEDDLSRCKTAENLGIPLVSSEFIMTGILRHQLDFDSFRLTHIKGDNGKRPAAQAATKDLAKKKKK